MANLENIEHYKDEISAELTLNASNRELKIIASKLSSDCFSTPKPLTAIGFIQKAATKKPEFYLLEAALICSNHLPIQDWIKALSTTNLSTWHIRTHVSGRTYRLTSLILEISYIDLTLTAKLLNEPSIALTGEIKEQLRNHLDKRLANESPVKIYQCLSALNSRKEVTPATSNNQKNKPDS